MSKLIVQIENITLSFGLKQVLQDLCVTLHLNKKIALVGNNGAGKSSLLKIIAGQASPDSGRIIVPKGLSITMLNQNNFKEGLSGGEGFNKALTEVLVADPEFLILDEPSNHLDSKNRSSLIRIIKSWQSGLIVATHDQDLIKACDFDQVWEIDEGKCNVFDCSWAEFCKQKELKKNALLAKAASLDKEKRSLKKAVEFQRKTCSKRASVNSDENDKLLLRAMQASGEATLSKKLGQYSKKLEQNMAERANTIVKKEFQPKFNLLGKTTTKTVIQIVDGEVSYAANPLKIVVEKVNLMIFGDTKLLISGRNGKGKSTLLKAIVKNPEVAATGQWFWKENLSWAMLDQHYKLLSDKNTVFEQIKQVRPDWTTQDVQKHLNDFLFIGPEASKTFVGNLSGGERARLALAQIGACTPELLILDEPSNNLDAKSKSELAKVIAQFPGAVVLVCHEQSFIDLVGIEFQKYDL